MLAFLGRTWPLLLAVAYGGDIAWKEWIIRSGRIKVPADEKFPAAYEAGVKSGYRHMRSRSVLIALVWLAFGILRLLPDK